jgi:putative endonuclease
VAKTLWVYIMASRTRRLYVGCTSNLPRRVWQHRTWHYRGFTSRYHINRLVRYESTTDAWAAVRRERQLKGWLRLRKVALVEAENPEWRDLAADVGLEPFD